MFNLSADQIITFDPINVSNLIASVAVALVAVYFTMWLNQKRDFQKSRDGLITEINRNFLRCEHISRDVKEIIENYSQDSAKGTISLATGFDQDYSAYNYFTQQGYFIKLPMDFRIKIENYYHSSKRILSLYNQDPRYRDDIKNSASLYKVDYENLRLNQSLLQIQYSFERHKELYDNLIKEMIKLKWLTRARFSPSISS